MTGPTRAEKNFVAGVRLALPYIRMHRGKTFVIAIDGEAVQSDGFSDFISDVALLRNLGVRVVLVHGARPQIEKRLDEAGVELRYCPTSSGTGRIRITHADAMPSVMQAVAGVRVQIEASLSMGLPNSPMEGANIPVVSGNFVRAQPVGVIDGVDYQLTGKVRSIDTRAISTAIENDALVLLSPLGMSITGELFNLSAQQVAAKAAAALNADKLIYLSEVGSLPKSSYSFDSATAALDNCDAAMQPYLESALQACEGGVTRCHIIDRKTDGSLLLELFTRDGVGSLITNELTDRLEVANSHHVPGIINLIEPLERDGILVRRSRKQLELELNQFRVMCIEGTVIGCAALYPYPEHGKGELACVVMAPDYRDQARGKALLDAIVMDAKNQGLEQIFVLTTQSAHWFIEQGFVPASLEDLPSERQRLYNFQRNSQVLVKTL